MCHGTALARKERNDHSLAAIRMSAPMPTANKPDAL